MAPQTAVTITRLEPAVFLRGQSASGEDGRGRRRHVNLDAPPSQLRALLSLTLLKPSKIKDISISLTGIARTDWPEGIGPNRLELSEESVIIKQVVSLFNAKRERHMENRLEAGGNGRRRCTSEGELNHGGEASQDEYRSDGASEHRPSSSNEPDRHFPGSNFRREQTSLTPNGSSFKDSLASAMVLIPPSLRGVDMGAVNRARQRERERGNELHQGKQLQLSNFRTFSEAPEQLSLGQNGVGRLGTARGFNVSAAAPVVDSLGAMTRSCSSGGLPPSSASGVAKSTDPYLSPANDRVLSPLEKGLLKLSKVKAGSSGSGPKGKDKGKGKSKDGIENFDPGYGCVSTPPRGGSQSLPVSRVQTPVATAPLLTEDAQASGLAADGDNEGPAGDYFGASAPGVSSFAAGDSGGSSAVPWDDPPMYTYYNSLPPWPATETAGTAKMDEERQSPGATTETATMSTALEPISSSMTGVQSSSTERESTAASSVSESGSKPLSPFRNSSSPSLPANAHAWRGAPAPETVWAAGPSGKGILQHSGQSKGKGRVAPRNEQVRFDAAALACAALIDADIQNEGGAQQAPVPSSPKVPSASASTVALNEPIPHRVDSHSSATSSRTTLERRSCSATSSPEHPINGSSASSPLLLTGTGDKPKDKSPIRSNSVPGSGVAWTVQSASPGAGAVKGKEKGGLKGLLSGLNHDHKSKERERDKDKSEKKSFTPSRERERERDKKELKELAKGEKQDSNSEWQEFKAGAYTFPICIPLPSNLPPTLHADFGSNQYTLKALVQRAGALTPNLTTEREVTFIHAPDEDEMEGSDAIVVQRTWEDALSYVVVISGKSFPLGSKIPMWLKFVPLTKVKIHRIVATMEEKTDYYAKNKRVARHEVPRRWNLLKLANSNHEPLLPLLDDSPDALATSVLGPFVAAAAEDSSDALPTMLDPNGPWELVADLELSKKLHRINLSSNHKRSNIAVHHMLRLTIRVEREEDNRDVPADGKRRLFDIVIEAPIALNHSYTNEDWIKLPNYDLARDDVSPGSANPPPPPPPIDQQDRSPPPAVLRAFSPTVARKLSEQRHQPAPRMEAAASLGTTASSSSRQLTRRWLALSETAGRFGARLELPGERRVESADDPLPPLEPPPPSYQTAVFSRPVLMHAGSEDAVAQVD
ncbi:hypothetical protein K437DRAFT_253132 [Tilletiaria anomala UBC 951]|uniref:Arrestin C-terminal-like domain-containing protein n=1 Tax=Tilletiaria anomala (strain ATCC 24038 / CBS 436.72 / UBC 951) TaxID=1037660 RepID=A0A066WR14_TILAU|nr:uncharacterized protein K437DRAFT_253132 [Tilletiaria anomala UBC 951]KDN53434.1 hypothetical protein K437DRAFT_253132 [Tilletiaria anomala UBC 951]